MTPTSTTMAVKAAPIHQHRTAFHPYGSMTSSMTSSMTNFRLKSQIPGVPLQKHGSGMMPTSELQRLQLHHNVATTARNIISKNSIIYNTNAASQQRSELQHLQMHHNVATTAGNIINKNSIIHNTNAASQQHLQMNHNVATTAGNIINKNSIIYNTNAASQQHLQMNHNVATTAGNIINKNSIIYNTNAASQQHLQMNHNVATTAGNIINKNSIIYNTNAASQQHLQMNHNVATAARNIISKSNIMYNTNFAGQQHSHHPHGQHQNQQQSQQARPSQLIIQPRPQLLEKPHLQQMHLHQPKHQQYQNIQSQHQKHFQDLTQKQFQHQQHFDVPQKQMKVQTSDTPVLPPCRVCSDKSTGIHYGAMTCEACKGFFRRSLSRKNEFHCITGTQSCDIHYGGKTPCAYCRLAKCIAIGMSREGIKRGRYTLSQRTSHIKEVKALQQSDSYAKQYLPKTPGDCILTLPPSVEVTTLEGNITRYNYQGISKAVLTAYLVHCQYPPDIEQNLEEIQHLFLKRKSREDVNISEYSINNEDLFTEIHENGWLVKDRLKMLHKRIQFIEEAVKRLVCFAKNIPGFKKLPMDDQMTLVKSVQFYWWFLSVYPGMSLESQLYTTPLRDTVSCEDIAQFMTEKFADTVFHLAGVFNGLKLSEEERALVLGLSVMSTDGCPEIEDQSAIEQIYEGLAQTLYYLTKDKHPDQPARFGRIVAALTELRSAEAPHVEAENITRGHIERMKIEVPPLLLELWAALPRKR